MRLGPSTMVPMRAAWLAQVVAAVVLCLAALGGGARSASAMRTGPLLGAIQAFASGDVVSAVRRAEAPTVHEGRLQSGGGDHAEHVCLPTTEGSWLPVTRAAHELAPGTPKSRVAHAWARRPSARDPPARD